MPETLSTATALLDGIRILVSFPTRDICGQPAETTLLLLQLGLARCHVFGEQHRQAQENAPPARQPTTSMRVGLPGGICDRISKPRYDRIAMVAQALQQTLARWLRFNDCSDLTIYKDRSLCAPI